MAGVDKTVATLEVRVDDQASGPAKSAAKALADLQSQIKRESKELGEMQRALRALKGATDPNIEQINKLKAAIESKKNAVAKAQEAFIGLGGSFRASARESKRTSSSYAELAAAARGSGGQLGAMSARLQSLTALMSNGVAIAVGLAAAVAAVTAAVAASVVSLGRYAIAQADARRSELLRLEGLASIRTWMGYATTTGSALQASLDDVSASTSLARSDVARYAESLHRAGLRGDALTVALRGVATVAAVQGEEQAQLWSSMMAGAHLAGQSVSALADRIQARIGGIAAKQMLSLSVQVSKARESFDALFRGVGIEPFLEALSKVTSLFSQSTASGRALKEILTIVINPMVSAITAAMPVVRRFFQGMILMSQDLTIAILDVAIWLKKTFGAPAISGIDALSAALFAGRAAIVSLVIALAPVAVIIGALSVIMTGMAGIVYGVAKALSWLAGVYVAAYKWILNLPWSNIGTAIVNGMIGGIRRMVAALRETVVGLGKGAMDALKSTLGISSPSKVFARLGVEIPRGLAQGIESGDSQTAASEMVSPPDVSGSRPAMRTVNLTIGEITVSAGGNAREVAAGLRYEIERVFADLATSMGAA